MNRIDRVTAILIQLQSRKIVKAQEMADRFKVSLRTVYRDIKTLEEAGVPIIGEAGQGYSLMEGYRLPPVMFTHEEATAFLTAEKIMEKFSDASTIASYKSAMFKVRAVLRSSEKDLLENIEQHIEVVRSVLPYNEDSLNNALQPILKSIAEKKVMQITYTAFHSEETTQRKVEPVGVFYASGFWHAIAFCRLRNDYRDFRTDRIQKIQMTDEVFQKEHPSLKTYLEQVAQKQQLIKVVFRVKKETTKYLQQQKYYFGFVSEKQEDDHVQMTFLTSYIEMFGRWFITFADAAEILQPASLKHFMKEHIHTLAEKYLIEEKEMV